MLLIRGFTLPKSASAKPARSTGFTKFGCNVKNGAASKISASILSPPCTCQGLSRLTAEDKTLGHFGIYSNGAYSV